MPGSQHRENMAYVRRVQAKLDQSGCNCGAADRTQWHTVHAANPTGHAVTCPVYLRWKESRNVRPR